MIDCSDPVEDNIIDMPSFLLYMQQRVKVNGKAGALGSKVSLSVEKAKLVVSAELPFSKRYLKYLSKKFLQKTELRNFVHLVATSKGAYEMKFFKSSGATQD